MIPRRFRLLATLATSVAAALSMLAIAGPGQALAGSAHWSILTRSAPSAIEPGRAGAVATVLTNALPIVAGTLLFSEGIPSGAAGVARIGAFAAVVIGAALLAQADPEPEPTAVPAV